MSAEISPRAREDLLDAARWIAKDNPSAARALRNAVIETAKKIGDFPEIGALRPAFLAGPRRILPMTGFPYVIIYNAARKPPLILRVLHAARDLPDIVRGFD